MKLKSLAFFLVFAALIVPVGYLTASPNIHRAVLGVWLFIAILGWAGIWRDIGTWWKSKRTKMKGPSGLVSVLTTGLLIAALSSAPMQLAEARPDDTHDGDVIAQCVCVLVVGGVVCWGIWKMCSRIPQPPPAELQPPPPTNYPPAVINPTNRPPHIKKQLPKTNGGITSRAIEQFHMPDPVSEGQEFHTIWFTRMETSENLGSWRESLTVTGYVSDAGQYIGFWSNGACLYNAYVTPGSESYIPIEQGTGEEPGKFFRSVIP